MELTEAVSKLEDASVLEKCNSVDDIIKVFKDNNIEISRQEIENATTISEGELSDDMLDVVNGGINPVEIIKYLLKFVIGKIQD